MSWHRRFSSFGSDTFTSEKSGIPLYRIASRPPSGVLRWRWVPCVAAALAGIFVISTFCFGLFDPPLQILSDIFPSRVTPNPQDLPHWEGWRNLDKLFIFGESWSANGFDVNGTQPSSTNPFGNPTLEGMTGIPKFGPTGPLWIHYAATVYNRSLVKTYDLAVGGGTIDRALVNPVFPTAKTFGDQIENSFVPFFGPQGRYNKWIPSKTLFIVFFGIMDMIIPFHDSDRPPVEKLLKSYESELTKLYHAGARNLMLFNVPPVDRPYRGDKPGVRELHTDIIDFNKRLRTTRKDFAKRHPSANVFYFDTHSLFESIIADPKAVPQTNRLTYTKGPCPLYDLGIGFEGMPDLERKNVKCGVPVSQYLWHDFIHPTYPMHEAMAAKMVEDCMIAGSRKGYCS